MQTMALPARLQSQAHNVPHLWACSIAPGGTGYPPWPHAVALGQDRGISRSLPRSLVACFCHGSFPAYTASGEQGEVTLTLASSAWGLGRGCWLLAAQEGGLSKEKLGGALGSVVDLGPSHWRPPPSPRLCVSSGPVGRSCSPERPCGVPGAWLRPRGIQRGTVQYGLCEGVTMGCTRLSLLFCLGLRTGFWTKGQ